MSIDPDGDQLSSKPLLDRFCGRGDGIDSGAVTAVDYMAFFASALSASGFLMPRYGGSSSGMGSSYLCTVSSRWMVQPSLVLFKLG